MGEAREEIKTDDMCMVAALKYEGFTPQDVIWDGGENGKCFWLFLNVPSILEAIEAFMTKSMVVEPRQFNHLFGETKREFYKLYDAAKA